MDYLSKGRTKYLITYHVVLVTKYRRKTLIEIGLAVKNIIFNLANEKNFSIIEMEVDKDYIHILISTNPHTHVSSIIKLIKQVTTNRIWKEYPSFLKRYYWKRRVLWSSGYFVCTIGKPVLKPLKSI